MDFSILTKSKTSNYTEATSTYFLVYEREKVEILSLGDLKMAYLASLYGWFVVGSKHRKGLYFSFSLATSETRCTLAI